MKDPESTLLISRLRGTPMFGSVADHALQRLADSSRLLRLDKGQVLFNQGDPAGAFYVVYSGCINLLLDSANGRELVINEMRAGDGFGELGLLTDQPRSASAVAREESVVIVIPRRDFLAVLETQPGLVRNLLQTTAARLGSSSEREGALAFLNAPSRLARVLLLLDHQASTEGYVTISQEDLARRVGLARQTVASLMGKWRRSGWIITGRGKIMLLNRTALRRQAQEDDSLAI
jgi:CRP-like cAMP-binding protein